MVFKVELGKHSNGMGLGRLHFHFGIDACRHVPVPWSNALPWSLAFEASLFYDSRGCRRMQRIDERF